jgi:hypothetical protein
MKKLLTGAALLLLCAGSAFAGTNLNEVGAVLIYPAVVTLDDANPGNVETFVTITNAGGDDVNVHMAYINGDTSDRYCYECDFDIPLTPYDTETLLITHGPTGILVTAMDSGVTASCDWPYGFLVATVERRMQGDDHALTHTGNVLLGEQVVVNYTKGWAFSIPAISFQGRVGDRDRRLMFDNVEYSKLPRYVAADFLAPNLPGQGMGIFNADLILMTPHFIRQYPPEVDCSVNGFDAEEFPVSGSFQFGCWTVKSLCDISSEFCYPNLGQFAHDNHEHGWLHLHCRVDGSTLGGVHGAIVQTVAGGQQLRREQPEGPYTTSWAAWGRLLYQSVTAGDSVRLVLEAPYGGME